ncbi:hypothetical protein [Streptomyces sp. H27-C3]|uniref:hypothetical protein n=1 Tax=Streptomyces sp. H27-C3 TaxID=3046305 RepID=UPI0024B9B1E2|nr:hypothetical protein [Streptomyces sp. H27-C3]MDJ0466679.1 hypothetical protein [Streptomyces sp. H27-C3]
MDELMDRTVSADWSPHAALLVASGDLALALVIDADTWRVVVIVGCRQFVG